MLNKRVISSDTDKRDTLYTTHSVCELSYTRGFRPNVYHSSRLVSQRTRGSLLKKGKERKVPNADKKFLCFRYYSCWPRSTEIVCWSASPSKSCIATVNSKTFRVQSTYRPINRNAIKTTVLRDIALCYIVKLTDFQRCVPPSIIRATM